MRELLISFRQSVKHNTELTGVRRDFYTRFSAVVNYTVSRYSETAGTRMGQRLSVAEVHVVAELVDPSLLLAGCSVQLLHRQHNPILRTEDIVKSSEADMHRAFTGGEPADVVAQGYFNLGPLHDRTMRIFRWR